MRKLRRSRLINCLRRATARVRNPRGRVKATVKAKVKAKAKARRSRWVSSKTLQMVSRKSSRKTKERKVDKVKIKARTDRWYTSQRDSKALLKAQQLQLL